MFVFRFEIQIFLRHLFHHRANAKSSVFAKAKIFDLSVPVVPVRDSFLVLVKDITLVPHWDRCRVPPTGRLPPCGGGGQGGPPPLYPTQAVVSPSLSLPHCRKKISNCSKTKYLRTFLF